MTTRRRFLTSAAIGASALAAAPLIAQAQLRPRDVVPTRGTPGSRPLPTNATSISRWRPQAATGFGAPVALAQPQGTNAAPQYAQPQASRLLIDPGPEINTPDGLGISADCSLLIFSVPNFNNDHLLERKVISHPASPFMVAISAGNQVSRWYNFTAADMHPDTGRIGPMDNAFGPDGNLYVADMQVFFSKEHESPILCINVSDGKATGIDVVAEGFIAANGLGRQYALPDRFGAGRPGHAEGRRAVLQRCVRAAAQRHAGYHADPGEALRPKTGGRPTPSEGVHVQRPDLLRHGRYRVRRQRRAIRLQHRRGIGLSTDARQQPQGDRHDTVRARSEDALSGRHCLRCAAAAVLNRRLQRIAVHVIDTSGRVTTLQKNGDTTGANGELDQPAEVLICSNELLVVNMDMAWATPGLSVNTEVDTEYNLAGIDLPRVPTSK